MPTNRSSTTPHIEVAPGGPYLVRGVDTLTDPDGHPIPTTPDMALCRCGGSANKPFCDGTHREIGFSSAKLAERLEDKREMFMGRKYAATTRGTHVVYIPRIGHVGYAELHNEKIAHFWLWAVKSGYFDT